MSLPSTLPYPFSFFSILFHMFKLHPENRITSISYPLACLPVGPPYVYWGPTIDYLTTVIRQYCVSYCVYCCWVCVLGARMSEYQNGPWVRRVVLGWLVGVIIVQSWPPRTPFRMRSCGCTMLFISTCRHCIIVHGYWKCSRNPKVYDCDSHFIKSKSRSRTPWWQLINWSKFLSAIGYNSLASCPTLSSLPSMYDYSTFFVIMHLCVPKVTWSLP